ncbi:primosomal protein N' [Alicyclobacillus kakegawensis]|uniref:primosomal protein N' n=1 Tax=Alicyclobacillus kakegawensis TaxID=392012 RepID=UPI000AF6CED6|nr:primosomal protein N' [Alicyclobacillus kakegawensis]
MTDAAGSDVVADVLIDMRGRGVDRWFSYRVPASLKPHLAVGQRVIVPFGRRSQQGFVMRLREKEPAEAKLREIAFLVDAEPLLTEEMIELCGWLRWRYVCSWIEAVHAMLPSAYRAQVVHRVRAVSAETHADGAAASLPPYAAAVWAALQSRPARLERLERRFGAEAWLAVRQLMSLGLAELDMEWVDKARARTLACLEAARTSEELAALAEERRTRAKRQAQLLAALATEGRVRLKELGMRPTDAPVRALLEQGLARLVQVEVARDVPVSYPVADSHAYPLTAAQRRALTRIEEALRGALPTQELLLFGVTGSGKTEVFLRAMEQVLAEGGGAIVLVPEISLTPQMVGRFVARFGSQVAVLHSGLSVGQRRDEWLRIRRGEARIVVGARSAVFAPVVDLRLIVVDEEHEPSYKQDDTPHYDAREVARQRVRRAGRVVVLASATPSLTSMHRVETGLASLVTLPRRVGQRSLPAVEVVDMRAEMKAGNRSLFSRALAAGMREAVDAGHQAILFLNRRGFAQFVLCRSCGESLQCPHCDISLTVHKAGDDWSLRCHYCGHRAPWPGACPACGETALRPFGIGTQQVEALLAEQWPGWRILRMDVDTTRRQGAHQEAMTQFLSGEADVLVGTQMIAKGLDFPNVAFVGVLAADTMLAVPDYRAAERTFDLLTQVAGRAGRGDVPGRTVIQTFRPEHFAIAAAASHDYGGFYRAERAIREQFFYPPFSELAVFVASHSEERWARAAASRFERELRRRLPTERGTVLPAHPAGILRMEDQFRYQVVVKYTHWQDVADPVSSAFLLVREKMRRLGGVCVLDVGAGKIA